MHKEELEQCAARARRIRMDILEEICAIGSGHVGGSFSIVEALTVLYWRALKNIDPKDPGRPGRDRFILSKGHAGPALYATLAQRGYFPREMLQTLNQGGTLLPSHADMNRTPGVDMTTGSLGQGLSCAVGMAYAAKIKKEDDVRIFCLIGDGESQEGQIWEAAISAANLRLDNLIVMLDYNGFQLDGALRDVVDLGDVAAKWRAFGFSTVEVDGHNLAEIDEALSMARETKGRPSMVILHTIKGKGVPFIEAMGYKNHSMPVTEETLCQARPFLLQEVK
ncbi:Transketolase, N-terminal section [Clostridiaceae bacterium JG1575]|nr:Transketolase, N-terminal section [Clostridiaceae bacterium JG1575]